MKFIFFLINILFFVSSCSMTPIEMDELDGSKAYYMEANGDIIWKKQIYEKNFLTGKYNTSKLFADSIDSKKIIEKANLEKRKSQLWLLSGLYLSALYLGLSEQIAPKDRGLYMWVLLGIGVIPAVQFNMNANDYARDAVKRYNQKVRPGLTFNFTF